MSFVRRAVRALALCLLPALAGPVLISNGHGASLWPRPSQAAAHGLATNPESAIEASPPWAARTRRGTPTSLATRAQLRDVRRAADAPANRPAPSSLRLVLPGDSGGHKQTRAGTPSADAPPATDATSVNMDLPTRMDLSPNTPPVADQGGLSSCGSWAFGYYLRGYYALRDGYYPQGTNGQGEGGFAAGYLYTQLAGGQNDTATSEQENMDILRNQGIDANADFTQGNDQVALPPTASEQALAARYKIAGGTTLTGTPGENRPRIEHLLAAGDPLVLNIALYPSFLTLDAGDPLFTAPGGAPSGSHFVTAFGYDEHGVWVENSWGTGWGLNGWAELSWSWLESADLYAMTAITPITPSPLQAPAPSATATVPTPSPSATPDAASPTPAPAAPTATASPRPPARRPLSAPAGRAPQPALQLGLVSFAGEPDGRIEARWSTTLPATGQLFWRPSPGATRASAIDPRVTLTHAISVAGLRPGQTYLVWVRSALAKGHAVQSAPLSLSLP